MRVSVIICFAALALSASLVDAASRRSLQKLQAKEGPFRFAETAKMDYEADSGGCTPLSNYEKMQWAGNSKWQEWEKRLTSINDKVKSMSAGEKAAYMLEALGSDNIWHQIVDGWSHLKGPLSFGQPYVDDMKRGFKECATVLKKGLTKENFETEFYIKIHQIAFEKTAVELGKKNGLRGSNSWIYLPMPDKPLGVFHDVHLNGKKTYSPALRKVDKNGERTPGWKYNHGFQMRWVYPNIDVKYTKGNITELFNQFWSEMDKIKTTDENEARNAKLTAVIWLYHSLENLHPYVDGNGRTDILVLDTLLCHIGMHPVAFYNSMESALSSVDEMKEKVLEGMSMWEKTILNIEEKKKPATGWTLPAIKEKNKECKQAIAKLWGKKPADGDFIPDTEGGCMCKNVAQCDSTKPYDGGKWCYTTADCTWKWDFCAPGRQKGGKPTEVQQSAYMLAKDKK